MVLLASFKLKVRPSFEEELKPKIEIRFYDHDVTLKKLAIPWQLHAVVKATLTLL